MGGLAVLVSLAGALRADAQTIDFSSCAVLCQIDNGDTFSENGLTLTGTSGSGGSINGGVPDPDLGLGGQVIRLTRNGGGLFDFLSFDLELRSSLDALGTFVVTSSNGGIQNVSALGTYPLSGPTWEDVSWVDFTVVTGEFFSDNNTIDNIVVLATPLAFSKAFGPNPISAGGVSTLTFTIDNASSPFASTTFDFTDNFPAGVLVATPSNASTTCTGGTFTAASGTSVVSYSAGNVAAGAACTASVDVTAAASGAYVNVTGDLTSTLGNSGTATDTLTVTTPVPVLPSGWLLALIGILMLGGGAWVLRRRTTTAGA